MTADRTPTGGGGSELVARLAADSVGPAVPQHPSLNARAVFLGKGSRGVAAFAQGVQAWRGRVGAGFCDQGAEGVAIGGGDGQVAGV